MNRQDAARHLKRQETVTRKADRRTARRLRKRKAKDADPVNQPGKERAQ